MRIYLTILLITVFLFSACTQNRGQAQSATDVTNENPTSAETKAKPADKSETECKICEFDFNAYKGELKKEEVEGLLLALNDEYMSWATYDQINKDFDRPRPFINIVKAEARHEEKLKELFETYKIPVPENKWIGETEKYESVKEACKAGIDAEIANAALYDRLFKSTAREDILLVYKSLQKASSENHLPAFKRCATRGGKGMGRGNN